MNMRFVLEEYRGKYVMHCKNGEEAMFFCQFLHNAGRTWCTQESYVENLNWDATRGGTGYGFNEGVHAQYDYWVREEPEYTILEFEDFEWDDPSFQNFDVDNQCMDEFLNTFTVG